MGSAPLEQTDQYSLVVPNKHWPPGWHNKEELPHQAGTLQEEHPSLRVHLSPSAVITVFQLFVTGTGAMVIIMTTD